MLRRLVQRFALWLLAVSGYESADIPAAVLSRDAVAVAVRGACGLVGLPVLELSDTYRIPRHKRQAVLHHAVTALGPAVSVPANYDDLRTLGDVVACFKGQR